MIRATIVIAVAIPSATATNTLVSAPLIFPPLDLRQGYYHLLIRIDSRLVSTGFREDLFSAARYLEQGCLCFAIDFETRSHDTL
jgi:hypothetical protein